MKSLPLVSHSHRHIVLILLSLIAGSALTTALILGYGRWNPSPMVQAQNPATPGDRTFVEIAAQAKPAVVSIIAKSVSEVQGPEIPEEFRRFFRQFGMPDMWDKELPEKVPSRALGSGWIYSDDGYIVTNSHVVRRASDIRVKLYDRENDDKEYEAKLVGNDPRSELALLKIDAGRKLPTLKLGDSEALQVGEWVMAIGSPFELEQTVTVGVVSAKGRMLNQPTGRFRIGDIIQTDASINPGNSGGPLMNTRGEVVGVNVAILSGGLPGNIGIGFAIPSATVRDVIPVLKSEGKVARGWLGIQIQDLNANLREAYKVPEGGALVASIEKDGPASKSELQEDDVIVAIDGVPVHDTWTLQKNVANHRPGERVTLEVVRNGEKRKVEVKLGEIPAAYAGTEEPAAQAKEATPTKALGLTLAPITREVAQAQGLARDSGVYVQDVEPGSPADERGIQPGDVIVKIKQTEVKTVEDVVQAVEAAKKANEQFIIMRLERKQDDGLVQALTVDVELKK